MEPSALMTLRRRRVKNAMSPPTGEKMAVDAFDPAGASCTRFVPSGLIAQMVVPQLNAILHRRGTS